MPVLVQMSVGVQCESFLWLPFCHPIILQVEVFYVPMTQNVKHKFKKWEFPTLNGLDTNTWMCR